MGRHTHFGIDPRNGLPVGYDFNEADAQTQAGRASLLAGMPAGFQMFSDWFVLKTDFVAEGTGGNDILPVSGADWTITEQGVATQALSADLFPPHLILTNAGADNDSTELQRNAGGGIGEFIDFTAPGREHYFETLIRFADANQDADTVEQLDFFVGWAVTDTTVIDGATDFIGFVKQDLGADAAQDIDFVSADAGGAAGALVDGSQTASGWTTDLTTSGVTAANTAAGRVTRRQNRIVGPNDWVKLAFKVQPGVDAGNTNVGSAHVYVNDTHRGTVDLAGQVPDQNLCTTIAFQNGEAVAKIMHVAYILEAVRYRTAAGVLIA